MPNSIPTFLRWLILPAAWFSWASGFAQTPPLTLPQTVAAAGFIFSGQVLNVWSARDTATGFIVTYATVAVRDGIRGVAGSRFTFKQYGGSYNGVNVFVADMSYFFPGEEVVALLYPVSALGLTSPVGATEGKWTIQRDPATGKKFVAANALAPKMPEPSAANATQRMEYESFIKLIRELAARDGQP